MAAEREQRFMNGCSSFLIGDQKRMVGLMRGTCDLFRLWSLGVFGEKLGVLCLPDGQARLFFGLQKANQLPAQFGQVAALSEEEAQIHEMENTKAWKLYRSIKKK